MSGEIELLVEYEPEKNNYYFRITDGRKRVTIGAMNPGPREFPVTIVDHEENKHVTIPDTFLGAFLNSAPEVFAKVEGERRRQMAKNN